MYKILLNDAYKNFTLDQDKIITPTETVDRFKEKLQSVDLDILEETVRFDSGRLDIPVYFSSCGKDAKEVIGTKKQMGKGATPEQSEASAVMELAERFSFFSFCHNPQNFFTDIYRNVKELAVPFELIAQSVHDESDDLPVIRSIFEEIPFQWTWGYNFTVDKEVLIPFNWFYTINEFNGPSAGNCAEEAILQGICEIVERHVSSIISQNNLSIPAIRPESASDPMVVEMLKKYSNIGVKLFISDFTLGMGIPSIGVLAYDPATYPEKSEIVWTAGTTPNPEKALSRALTEVAQLAGDFNTSSNYVASGLPKFGSLEDAAYIMKPSEASDIQQLPDLSDNNIKTEIVNCIKALADQGMQVMAINTMHSRLEIPAFYTIIPGAHFRERATGTSVAMFTAKVIAENLETSLAIEKLLEIDRLLPQKYFIHFYLSTCFLNMHKPEVALQHLQQSLAMNPNEQDLPSIYSYIGVSLKEMGHFRKALEMLREGEKIDPERTDIYNLKGFCHFKLKEHQAAIENFKKVLRLNPGSAIDYANIASNYRDMGEKGKAIRYYELALELDPTIDFARENLNKLEKSG
jgi:ribosomal protein S12 methylthiotransferase accessory factor